MKKKSLLLVFTGACISMMLAGCTGDVSAVTEPTEEQEIIIAEVEPEAGVEEVLEVVEEVEPEEPEVEEPEVDPQLELSKKYFNVSEERARDYCGLYLEQDGQLYAVTDQVPEQNYYDTGIGVRHEKDEAGTLGGWADDNHNSYIVYDLEVVFPIYEEGDGAILYTSETYSPDSLTFVPIEQKGYTISAYNYNNNEYTFCVLEDWDKLIDGRTWIAEYEVYDSEGNSVENIRDLNRGEKYTICYDGGKEIVLEAKCRYYESDEANAIVLTGEDQGDGSIRFDLDNLPSGDYWVVESYGFITIQ